MARNQKLAAVMEKRPRLSGLIMIIIGAALTYWQIIMTLLAAQKHVPELHYSMKMWLISLVIFVYGFLTLIFGKKLLAIQRQPRGPQKTMILLVTMICILGAAIAVAMADHYLTSLGYKRQI